MAIEKDGETYYNATEAAKYLSISKDTFYRSVKDRLPYYRLGHSTRAHYRKSEIDALEQSIETVQPEKDN
jgi:excisionase family DNA binding protein